MRPSPTDLLFPPHAPGTVENRAILLPPGYAKLRPASSSPPSSLWLPSPVITPHVASSFPSFKSQPRCPLSKRPPSPSCVKPAFLPLPGFLIYFFRSLICRNCVRRLLFTCLLSPTRTQESLQNGFCLFCSLLYLMHLEQSC